VIARTIEAFHQAKSDWVTRGFEHDWNRGPGVLGNQRPRGRGRRDDGDLTVDEIRCEARQPVEMTFGPAVFDSDVLAVTVTCFFQSLAKRGSQEAARIGSSDIKESNHRLGRLLRTRGRRTKRRSNENSDKFAPPHLLPRLRDARTRSV